MTEQTKEQTVSNPVEAVVSGISEILADSFMTCNSKPSGDYDVNIKVNSLKEAHKLHRLLIEIRQSC